MGMGHVLCIGNQKGGVGKTTTSIMLAYLISQFHKVLCIDMTHNRILPNHLPRRQQ